MWKRALCIAMIVLLITLICFSIINKTTNNLNLKQLNGDLLIENKLDKKNNTFGAVRYTTSNSDIKLVFNEEYYTPYCFSEDRSKMLLLKYIEKPTVNDYVIFEYDIKNKVLTGIIKFKEKEPNEYSTAQFSNIRYIPGEHKISYLWYDELYVFDTDSKTETLFTKVDRMANSYYGWSKYGNKLIFSKDGNINIFESSKNKIITTDMRGCSPIFSQGEKYIAYLDEDNFNHCLKVRDIVTGKELSYITKDIIVNYVFSPDDKYLAIVEKDTGLFKFGAHVAGHIKVWDYKNSSFGTLMKYYEGDTIDWK
jgi:Periplasmic component of the Tol biopolymer transport system